MATNSFSFSLGLMVLCADIQDTQLKLRAYHDDCPLRKRLCYLSYFDNSSHHNKWNKRKNLFCFVTLLWIIFIYDIVLNNVRARHQRNIRLCGVTWFPGSLSFLIWTHGRLTSRRHTPLKVVNASMHNEWLIAVRWRLLNSGENWVT